LTNGTNISTDHNEPLRALASFAEKVMAESTGLDYEDSAFVGKARVSVILHITKREQWEKAMLEGVYRGDTLDSQGFTHCSTFQQIVKVANALFRSQEGLVLLCIETDKVQSEIRYEGAGGEELYPHIYGPLNINAVVKVADFEPAKNGKFVLPKEITDTKTPP
jgi:uncharacterized protein (DUF952 family)